MVWIFLSGFRPSSLSGRPETIKSRLDRQLYKIGVWIGHKTSLFDQEDHLITKRLEGVQLDIITENNKARLGGNYQDKICAAMLFNNTFISVERMESARDKKYYPWVRSAYSVGVELNGTTEFDFEVQKENLLEAKKDFTTQGKHPEKGYFKKYFYLWQGRHFYHLQDLSLLDYENVSRFKMVSVKEPAWKKYIRDNGVIRVLEGLGPNATWEEAYHQWLQKWLKEEQCRIRIRQGNTPVGQLIFDQDTAQYYSQDDYLDELSEEKQELYGDYPVFDLGFRHGNQTMPGDQSLGIRSHGVLAQYFFQNLRSINDFDQAEISTGRIYELLEVIQTKICIFDKRVAERVGDNKKRDFLRAQLKCGIHWEDPAEWEEVKAEGLSNYHFIIMHLSFIEALKDNSGKRYGEEGIVRFFDEQMKGQLSDNCLFVVTTGRGREEWWRTIQTSDYTSYVTFRPVEMLIEAVEQGRMRNDDIDLKFNLIKVLFGS